MLLGNSGGGSLMAMAQAELGIGDGWIGIAAHPGEGVFMLQVIDPSVADEGDPFSTRARARHVQPRQRLAALARAVHATTRLAGALPGRPASSASPGSTRSPRRRSPTRRRRGGRSRGVDGGRSGRRGATAPAHRVHARYLTIYRTLADPAYLDLSIDPDERPMGSLFAFPDPFDANYGRGGLARVMTARGWLSTWSGLSSHARLADTMPQVTVPTLLVHPTADTEIRVRQAQEIVANAGADDITYLRDEGRPALPRGSPPRGTGDGRRLAGQALPLNTTAFTCTLFTCTLFDLHVVHLHVVHLHVVHLRVVHLHVGSRARVGAGPAVPVAFPSRVPGPIRARGPFAVRQSMSVCARTSLAGRDRTATT